MQLPPDQVERFYRIWKPLILFVNRTLRVEPAMLESEEEPWNPQHVLKIREALWISDTVREAFITENPAGLPPADLAIVDSWRHRVAGTFYVFRHLKKHSLLIADGSRNVYAVLGLASTLDEVVPFTPCYAKAVLLPFEGQIIYDSLMVPYNIHFGPGIRRDLAETYKDAKERGAIITSLPPSRPEGGAEAEGEARTVNARVLEALRKHLYRGGRGPSLVERDVAAVSAFADSLANRPQPRSLRDFGNDEVLDYLTSPRFEERKETQRRQDRTALGRFLRFLRDTDRMDYWQAKEALALLRGGNASE